MRGSDRLFDITQPLSMSLPTQGGIEQMREPDTGFLQLLSDDWRVCTTPVIRFENSELRRALAAAWLLIEGVAEDAERALRCASEIRSSMPESQADDSV
jgi:hypothetical protein